MYCQAIYLNHQTSQKCVITISGCLCVRFFLYTDLISKYYLYDLTCTVLSTQSKIHTYTLKLNQPLYIEGRKICPVTFSPRLVKVFSASMIKRCLPRTHPWCPPYTQQLPQGHSIFPHSKSISKSSSSALSAEVPVRIHCIEPTSGQFESRLEAHSSFYRLTPLTVQAVPSALQYHYNQDLWSKANTMMVSLSFALCTLFRYLIINTVIDHIKATHTHRKERLLRSYIIKKYIPEKSAIEKPA